MNCSMSVWWNSPSGPDEAHLVLGFSLLGGFWLLPQSPYLLLVCSGYIFLLGSVLVGFIILGTCLFPVGYLICLHKVVHNRLWWSFWKFSEASIVMCPLSLLILFESYLFLVWLNFLDFIFQKKKLSSVNFFLFLFRIWFILPWYLLSPPFSYCDVVYSYHSSYLRYKVTLLIDFFLLF